MLTDTDVGQYVRVQTKWARFHQWQRGTTWNEPPIRSYVLWLVRRGVLDVTLHQQPFRISGGEVWLHAYDANRFITVREDAEWLTLGFDASLYGNIDALAPLAPAQWRPAALEPLNSWLQELVNTERANTLEGALIHSSLTRAVVAWCWNERGGSLGQLAQEHLSPWLNSVLKAMRNHPEMSVQQHVAQSGYSPAQFRRNFQQILGCSPRSYLVQIRLERGRHLLESTLLPVAHVAAQAGFSNPEHFSRQFAEHYGTTPSRYRKMAKTPKNMSVNIKSMSD